MASSLPASLLVERQEHEADAEREATEMENYNGVLRRSSVYINSSAQRQHARSGTPSGAYSPFTRGSLAKMWQRQVSATVPHDACRDHYGTPIFPFARLAVRWPGRFKVYLL